MRFSFWKLQRLTLQRLRLTTEHVTVIEHNYAQRFTHIEKLRIRLKNLKKRENKSQLGNWHSQDVNVSEIGRKELRPSAYGPICHRGRTHCTSQPNPVPPCLSSPARFCPCKFNFDLYRIGNRSNSPENLVKSPASHVALSQTIFECPTIMPRVIHSQWAQSTVTLSLLAQNDPGNRESLGANPATVACMVCSRLRNTSLVTLQTIFECPLNFAFSSDTLHHKTCAYRQLKLLKNFNGDHTIFLTRWWIATPVVYESYAHFIDTDSDSRSGFAFSHTKTKIF